MTFNPMLCQGENWRWDGLSRYLGVHQGAKQPRLLADDA